jgi:hypothetical protein
MKTPVVTKLAWSTASFSEFTPTMPMELSALGEHLNGCQGTHQRWLALHCATDAVHGFVATRFVTTLVILALLIGAGLAVL